MFAPRQAETGTRVGENWRGQGLYRLADVTERLGGSVRSLGPRRAPIISKGMIYSPAHGDIDFTVPMFCDFLRRNYPEH